MEELILVTPASARFVHTAHTMQLTVYDITLVWKNQIAAAFLSKNVQLENVTSA